MWHLRQAVAHALGRRPVRICLLATGLPLAAIALLIGGLWWRLSVGPIPLDMATPWLTAAITENLGNRYKVEIGGTVIELDENRRMAVRVRDIVVRDTDGTVVATAPKAEAGLTVAALMTGRPRVESISLVGAEIALRVETDGTVTIFAGADKRPIATSPVLASAGTAPIGLKADSEPTASMPSGSAAPARSAGQNFAALLAWVDSLGSLGLDGGALTEVGLKSGNLVVDDQRSGRQSRFENIHLTMTRPQPGELSVTLGSQDPERPWVVVGAVKATQQGSRVVRIEARKVSVRDILMALRLDGGVESDLPISASLRAEIAADGTPQFATGRLLAGPGMIGEVGDALNRVTVDRFEASLEWDASRGMIVTPFQLVSGTTRMTLVAQAEPPADPGQPWDVGLRGGSVVMGSAAQGETPLLINRLLIRGRFDPMSRRLDVLHGEAAGGDVAIAMSGFFDLATSDPRIVVGMAARNMSATSFKRIWPPFVNPPVREWVMDNMTGGALDRIEIATNAPLSTLRAGGPPVPDDGLSIEIVTNGTQIKLMEALPPIRESDLVMRVRGRQIAVALGRGVAELPSGRRMTVTNGLFEVPDSHGPKPPARVRARVDGPAPAAAEFLALDHIRDAAGVPLDPNNCRGTVSAQVTVATTIESDPPPGTFNYTVVADVTNFAVDKFALSQKIEAQTLRINANQQGYQVKGDVRVGGVPAAIELRKTRGDEDAELRLQATMDDAARTKLGFDAGPAVSGPIAIKLAGRMATNPDQDNRLVVESDLTQTRIDNLLPSWVKPAGKPARAVFTYVGRGKAARFEDVVIEGSGASVKGGVEIDGNGDFLAASFPVFGLSDGDKATLKAERGQDGIVKITLRGDVYDGRAFVKSVMGGSSADQKRPSANADVDIDMKIGALAGFNGEALRAVDLKLLRRGGKLESFNLSAKIGAEATLIGDLRGRVGGGGQVVYLESKDAGAAFRFTDTYARMFGGQMWVAMDPPSADQRPKEGLLNVRDFTVRGEPSLDRVAASGAAGSQNPGVEFSRMRVDFSKGAGRLMIRDGVVRGPMVGATLEGAIDYAANEVRLRGTFVPLYGLNNAFGQIPIVGLFLGGGDKEGLLGVTYEVVGSPGAPILRVNPISAVAPGVLRKFFEFPSTLTGAERTPDVRSSIQ
ncbi:MAG: hypothetical protein HXX10_17190 [Rhodoplanes sp.]|uniref:YhdP family protein n=1 Tax=Rhodoplanes sp. TaxID=1968906 RepID=UPI00181BEBBE|nr:DUF3971 domain-containing protein [Rhodoplanes sp.]NVO15770.1 hypothetical protein [Rhodoplanes sp.]